MQDQAFLGPESGLAVPDGEGGVDLYIATQWLHVDRDQVAASLGLPPDKVRLVLAGVGGAFGGREDLSMQIHACLLALHTGRPVKMVYDREESFFGHVHRHPAGCATSTAPPTTAASSTCARGSCSTAAPTPRARPRCARTPPASRSARTTCPTRAIDAYVAYTNNPPCGAMRGFGAVQVAIGHEAQMDKLAAALGMDPVELRIRNAMAPGSRMPTGQRSTEPAPVAELLERLRAMPLPPGGALRATCASCPAACPTRRTARACGAASATRVGFKNVGFSEGFDDYSTARVRLSLDGGEPLVEVHTAAAEVGQGLVTVQAQIARTELGVERVAVLRRRHARRLGRLELGLAPDLRHRRRGAGGLRGGARAA